MIYYTKNKVRRQRKFHNSLYGVQLIKDIRLYSEMCLDFKRDYEERLNSKKNKKERAERSIRRTRMNIQRTLEANLDNKSYFLTLTFKENIQDYKKANSKFHYFIRIKNKNIKYLAIKEHQKRGAIHYHLIVFDIDEKDLQKLKSSWNYGYTHSKKITNKYTYSISNYLTKYFTKEKNQLVNAGYRIFTKSTNLQKPLLIADGVVDEVLLKYNYNVDLEKYNWLQHDYIIEKKPTHDLAIKIKNNI